MKFVGFVVGMVATGFITNRVMLPLTNRKLIEAFKVKRD